VCGCGKKSTPRRGPTLRPSVGPTSTNGPINSAQFKALGISSSIPKNASRLDGDRLRIEKLRREAVKKRLNK
jgi:hypothetical protein